MNKDIKAVYTVILDTYAHTSWAGADPFAFIYWFGVNSPIKKDIYWKERAGECLQRLKRYIG